MHKNYRIIVAGVLLLVLSGFIGPASAIDDTSLQWGNSKVSHKLQRGEIFNYMDYSIKVEGLPPPVESNRYDGKPVESVETFAALSISKNGVVVDEVVLRQTESYVTPAGDIKITVKELPSSYSTDFLFESYNPWTILEIHPKGVPNIQVSVETDKENYISLPITEIIATIKITNSGSADAVNVNMDIQTELPVKNGGLKYHYDRVVKGETVIKTVKFSSPMIASKKTYRILANVSGFDARQTSYFSEFSKNIIIETEPVQTLSVTKTTVEKMYLKDNAMVSLIVKNIAKQDIKNVSITDTVPDGFKILGNHTLNWTVNIPVNKEFEYRYLIKPVISNKEGTVIPEAVVDFNIQNENYRITSGQSKIVVYGPNIILTKQVDVAEANPGDSVTVTITAENNGITPTRVFIIDEVPVNVDVTSGITAYEEFLEAERKVSFSYIIKINPELPVNLPPAKADYFELGNKGEKIRTQSQGVQIKKKAPVEVIEITPPDEEHVTAPEVNTVTPVPPELEPTPVEPPPSFEITKRSNKPDRIENPIDKAELENILMDSMLGCTSNNNNVSRTACNFFQQNQV